MKNVPFPPDEKKLSLKRALLRIALSTVAISGTVAIALLYYFHIQEIQHNDDRFTIKYIERTDGGKEVLPAFYLTELLGLSVDSGMNLMDFRADQARASLMASPLISSAEVRKVRPDTLVVGVQMRKPVFRLSDFSNTCLDQEGIMMPMEPFYDGGSLPECCLGGLGNKITWGSRASFEKLQLGLRILRETEKQKLPEPFQVCRIDVSKTEEPSFGQREAVLVFSNDWILRLRPDAIAAQMRQFSLLLETVRDAGGDFPPRVVDMRVPQLAFMRKL